MTDINKHSSLLRYRVNYGHKMYYNTKPSISRAFSSSLTLQVNKLECLSLSSFFRLAYYLQIKLRPTLVEHLALDHTLKC
jgi:hypothetical protein